MDVGDQPLLRGHSKSVKVMTGDEEWVDSKKKEEMWKSEGIQKTPVRRGAER